jgi:hypothetical protein
MPLPRKPLTLRAGILLLLFTGLIGTGAELLLMEHTEDVWQLIPLLLIGMSLLVLVWVILRETPASLWTLRVIMLLAVASGVMGSILHYRGNTEFELERTPELRGFALFRESMRGATPALAPGTMILLGALGLLFTYGHPVLDRHLDEKE